MEFNIEILKETKEYVVINKPSGLVIHADGKTDEPSVSDWVSENYPEVRGVGEPLGLSDGKMIDRPGIVHRLDRDTSGVLIIAKTQEMFEHLKEQFKKHEVQKIYNAFVYGKFKEENLEGTIDRSIARSKNDFRKWTAERGRRGKERKAMTEYKVLHNAANPESYSFLELRPKTGRTHQIRVHLRSISKPIVCDSLYAEAKKCEEPFGRLALHARELTFADLFGQKVTVEAPYPADFQKAIDQIVSV